MGKANDRRIVLRKLQDTRRRAYDLVKVWDVRMRIHDVTLGHERARTPDELPENDPRFWADLYHRSLVLVDDTTALCKLAEARYRETLAAKQEVERARG